MLSPPCLDHRSVNIGRIFKTNISLCSELNSLSFTCGRQLSIVYSFWIKEGKVRFLGGKIDYFANIDNIVNSVEFRTIYYMEVFARNTIPNILVPILFLCDN